MYCYNLYVQELDQGIQSVSKNTLHMYKTVLVNFQQKKNAKLLSFQSFKLGILHL